MRATPQETKLYFCAGAVPTDDEKAESELLGCTAFRNSKHGGIVEKCAAVAGKVPPTYLAAKVKVLTLDKPKTEKTEGKPAK